MEGWSEKEGVLGFVGFDDDVLEDDDDVIFGVWFVRCCERGVDFGVEALMAILVLHIGK